MDHAKRAGATSDVVAVVVAALLLMAAMVFGGGPRGAGDLVVHLAAVPALVLGIVRWRQRDASGLQRLFLTWLIAAIALIALHLLPLPATVFAQLPQRAGVLADLQGADVQPAWLPMTLDVWGSVRGLLALLSFAAMWLLASTLPLAMRVRLLQLAIVTAVVTALLGFAQAAAAEHSALRLYGYHHPIGAIGTFANRNHFASLLAMLVPLALAFALRAQRTGQGTAAAWYAAGVILLLASALSYSRAGFALTLAALAIATVLLAWRGQGRPRRARAAMVPALVALVGALAVGYYAWDGLMQRLAQDPLADLRWQYLRYGWQAATQYLPWGSGIGSFQLAYAPLEPVSAMTSVYAERAHNDLLQTLIEAGVPGAALLLAFIALLVAGVVRKIPMGRDDAVNDHGVLAVAFIAVCVPLLHSFVDYPLRTLCVSTVLALLLSLIHGTTGERPRGDNTPV